MLHPPRPPRPTPLALAASLGLLGCAQLADPGPSPPSQAQAVPQANTGALPLAAPSAAETASPQPPLPSPSAGLPDLASAEAAPQGRSVEAARKPRPGCDAPFFRETAPPPADPDDLLFHVNRSRAIPDDYPAPASSSWTPCARGASGKGPPRPHDFVCVPPAYSLRNREALRQIAFESPAPPGLPRTSDGLEVGRGGKVGFGPLLDEARGAGHQLFIRSGFRSHAIQDATFRAWVKMAMARGSSYDEAVARVSQTSARPGHSEHQLGTAVDLVFKIPRGGVYEGWAPLTFEQSPAIRWVLANAHRFGIVLTYGRDATDITEYAWEPWHYRFVGVEAADAIHRCGLSPEEALRIRHGLTPPDEPPRKPKSARR